MKSNFRKILTLLIIVVITASPALALAKTDCCSTAKSMDCCDTKMAKDNCDSKCAVNNITATFSDKVIATNYQKPSLFSVSFTENKLSKSLSYGIFTPPKFS